MIIICKKCANTWTVEMVFPVDLLDFCAALGLEECSECGAEFMDLTLKPSNYGQATA